VRGVSSYILEWRVMTIETVSKSGRLFGHVVLGVSVSILGSLTAGLSVFGVL
jgi:hypothetical protein